MTDVTTDATTAAANEPNTHLIDTLTNVMTNLPGVEAVHAANSKPTLPGFEPSDFNHKYATLRGYKYHYVEQGNPDGVPVILIHGFPDVWYGWRNQIRHLEKEGSYRIIAIDNLGSGETDHPYCELNQLEPYAAKNLCANLLALLDHLNIDKAVFIGHDWGGAIAWKFGLYYPERCLNIASVGTPHKQPEIDVWTAEQLSEAFPEMKHVAVFQTHEPETWFGGDVHKQAVAYMNTTFFQSKGTNVAQKQYLIDNFTRTTFHGGYNFYRTLELNERDELSYVGKPYTVPSLHIIVDDDEMITPAYVAAFKTDLFEKLEQVHIAEGGHFILTENPEEVNKILSAYLAKFHGKKQVSEQELNKAPIEE